MKRVIFLALVLELICGNVYALPRRRSNVGTSNYNNGTYDSENKTAQGTANIMARLRIVGHFGGNPGYEGCGSGPTRESAYNNCCFANSGMRTVDVGYAQDANGFWYCCRRYQ